MRYFFIFYTLFWSLSPLTQAYTLTATQSQSVAELMGSNTPLWYVETPTYKDGGFTLGTHAPTQDKYLILRYTHKVKGHIAHFSLEHHSALLRDRTCLKKEKAIPYQHPQLGTITLCSSVLPRNPQFVNIRAFTENQKAPYLHIKYIGPAAQFMTLIVSIKRIPAPLKAVSGNGLSAIDTSRTFYPINKQAQFNWPDYNLGDEQLFWGKPTSFPQWNRLYHRAIPYIPQQITLHMTSLFRHTSHSQVVKPEHPCGSGKIKSRYEHPQLGPYLLCTKTFSTPAHASATDFTPITHTLVYANPLAGNKLPHVSFYIHGLPQDISNMLGQVSLN